MRSKTGTRQHTFTYGAHAPPRTSAERPSAMLHTEEVTGGESERALPGDGFTSMCWQRSFEVGHAVVLLGVAGADDLDLVGRGAEIGQLGVGQLDVGGADVLLEPFGAFGAGDRHNPGLLIEQPDQRELGGGGAHLGADAIQDLDEGKVRLERLSLEPWRASSHVGRGERVD